MESNTLFKNRAISIHGNTYDYSLVNYISNNSKVTILCKTHGKFEQKPYNHLNGSGCVKCASINRGNMRMLTREQIIDKFQKIHGNTYDYKLVIQCNSHTRVKIICKIHGEFEQRVSNHANGQGCNNCGVAKSADSKKYSQDQIIDRFHNKHGEVYDYSLVNFVDVNTKVTIICKKHGQFNQTPSSHINGCGCKKCGNLLSVSNRKFMHNGEVVIRDNILLINRFKSIHGDLYDYSAVEYINLNTCVKILCKHHGEFEQTPAKHIIGQKCPKCSGKNLTVMEWVERFNKVHGNKYNYEKIMEIKNVRDTLQIICGTHGYFAQSANDHYHGKSGCPRCFESKGIVEIVNILNKLNIKFVSEKKFDTCVYKRELPFDVYLPDYDALIEYDGMQHFVAVDFFGGLDSLIKTQRNDRIKNKWAADNNKQLVRIRFDENVEKKLVPFLDNCAANNAAQEILNAFGII